MASVSDGRREVGHSWVCSTEEPWPDISVGRMGMSRRERSVMILFIG